MCQAPATYHAAMAGPGENSANVFRFRAELWEHEGPAAWYFISLPDDVADDIEERFGQTAGGFGSIRVQVTIGATTWQTSLFPDSKRATYVLPVKKPVRTAEQLSAGSRPDVRLDVVA
jgi:Domain of unknown function (DUF1905)